MRFRWFRRTGIFFIPCSPLGWLVLLAAIGFAINMFFYIDGRSHSVSDTLIGFTPRLLLLGIAYMLLAFITSAPSRKP
ncbi:MAG: hypothetical protein BGO69_19360 [Bacteroidetes bacterium 46-16]|nr:MAG: hypothetical protein BGO69_19360 [Bacteroidetes bacterium 46-16]